MYSLPVTEVIAFVRKSIDELEENASSAYSLETDDLAIDSITKQSIVEAITLTHSASNSSRLDGKTAKLTTDYTVDVVDGVATIKMNTEILRIVSVRCSDSPVVVTSVLEEDSAEARMQNNPHIRGRNDNPILVLVRGESSSNKPTLKYYSTLEPTGEATTFSIEYIPKPIDGSDTYLICEDLKFAVLNMVVSLVMSSFKETEVAGIFQQRALTFTK